MSISKPQLKNPWASSGSANMADPGGVNDTGIPSLAKSIPRRWLNWILNKIETPVRYLVARGIPDYDANESYSVGDRVQWGGGPNMTFVCVVASVGDGTSGNSPGSAPTKWARWARGIPAYDANMYYQLGDTVFAASDGLSYQCILAHGLSGDAHEPHASPTYWKLWGYTEDGIIDVIHANENIAISTSSTGISLSTGSVSDVVDAKIGYATVLRELSFTLADIPSVPGYIDVTLGSPIAFASGIKNVQVTSAVATTIPAYGERTGSNTARIHCVRNGGPMGTAYVRLTGY